MNLIISTWYGISAMGIGNGSYGRDHGIAFIGNNATLGTEQGRMGSDR